MIERITGTGEQNHVVSYWWANWNFVLTTTNPHK